MNRVFCVISHTHWDREWYAPLELFRHRLTDLFDRLLVILEENPDYTFHLDAQTVVLEDYLAVRPEKKAILKEHIRNRRIMVGPWFLQNDFYLTSGESTVRNLIEGSKLCTEFGGSGKIGYAPDQFGNVSQLPQILDNFGIDNFVFGRGFSEYERDENGNARRKPSPTEFIWQGADGTKLLAIHMRSWYNNAQRFSADIDKAYKFLRSIEGGFNNEWTLTPYLLLMNGVDHLEPQPDLLPILNAVGERLGEGEAVMQYNFDDYVADVKQYIDDNDIELSTHTGEIRSGHDWELLKGTLSSRHYLKVANCEAQIMLENRLEPLFCMMERAGMKGSYPADQLRYTWKNLMRNHPHDSICGCSRDEIHAHMENRYAEIFEYGYRLMERGIQDAADHSSICRKGATKDYMLTVANTLSVKTGGCAKVTFKFAANDGFDNFEIFDEDGNSVDFTVVKKYNTDLDVFSPINLPGTIPVKVYDAYVDIGEIAPFSFKNFLIKEKADSVEVAEKICCDCLKIKNDALEVSINDGSVDILEKATGRVVSDCIRIEEIADIGDAYVFVKAGDEAQYITRPSKVELVEKNGFYQAVKLVYDVTSPAFYDYGENKRSEETVTSTVSLTLSLSKGDEWVSLNYSVDNKAKDHRIRIVVNTDVISEKSSADIAYDIVSHTDADHFFDTYSKVLPNATFAALCDAEKGAAVFTVGAHEYEHIDERCLAFTIIRGTPGINRNPSERWRVPANQELRVIDGRMAIMPFTGDVISADVANKSLRFRAPVITCAAPCDTHKFTGGRPCVQDTEIQEFFYLPDLYPEVAMKSNLPAVTVEGEGIQVTAFKRSEDASALVIRFVNLSDNTQNVKVCAKGKIYKSTMAEIRREFIAMNCAELSVASKKIITLVID